MAREDDEAHDEWQERLSEDEKRELAEWQKAHRWSPNQIRHLVATKLERKYDAMTAKAVLGNSLATAQEVYIEQDRNAARRAVEGL